MMRFFFFIYCPPSSDLTDTLKATFTIHFLQPVTWLPWLVGCPVTEAKLGGDASSPKHKSECYALETTVIRGTAKDFIHEKGGRQKRVGLGRHGVNLCTETVRQLGELLGFIE